MAFQGRFQHVACRAVAASSSIVQVPDIQSIEGHLREMPKGEKLRKLARMRELRTVMVFPVCGLLIPVFVRVPGCMVEQAFVCVYLALAIKLSLQRLTHWQCLAALLHLLHAESTIATHHLCLTRRSCI